ncbi:MAG: hypothetical protein H0V29_07305, partial [Thermoleophilaceae bacterium]|nr:hypothetical protein [Thermoleophilaceae bacterium]
MEAREEITVALAQVWEESEGLLDQRVVAVEAAAHALETGALPEREREEAEHAAHK